MLLDIYFLYFSHMYFLQYFFNYCYILPYSCVFVNCLSSLGFYEAVCKQFKDYFLPGQLSVQPRSCSAGFRGHSPPPSLPPFPRWHGLLLSASLHLLLQFPPMGYLPPSPPLQTRVQFMPFLNPTARVGNDSLFL